MATPPSDQPAYKLITITKVTKENEALLRQAVGLTDKFYGIENQKESLAGFEKHMQGNDGSHQEGWIVAVDNKNRVVAATNFAAYKGDSQHPVPQNNVGAEGYVVDIYTPVGTRFQPGGAERDSREGMEKMLAAERNKVAQTFVGGGNGAHPKLVTFVEQNDPSLMTAGDFLKETRAGNNEFDALKANTDMGLRPLEFRYIQPSLGKDGPSSSLRLMAGVVDTDGQIKPLPKEGLSKAATADFMTQYFAGSFPKGTSLKSKGLEAMSASLQQQGEVIPTAGVEGHDKLARILTPDAIRKELTAKLPKDRQHLEGMPLGEHYATHATEAMGSRFISDHADTLPYAARQLKAKEAAKKVNLPHDIVPAHESVTLPPMLGGTLTKGINATTPFDERFYFDKPATFDERFKGEPPLEERLKDMLWVNPPAVTVEPTPPGRAGQTPAKRGRTP